MSGLEMERGKGTTVSAEHAAALILVTTGVLTLVGWAVSAPRLAAWSPGSIPMSPVAGVLCVVLGAGFGISGAGRAGPVAGVLASLAVLVSGSLLTLRLRGVYLAAERLGLPPMHVAGVVAPTGYISLVSAGCYLAAALVLLILSTGRATPQWTARAAAAAGACLALIGGGFLLAHLFGAPALSGGAWIPPALNTSLTVLVLGGLLLVSGLRTGLLHAARDQPRGGGLVLLAVFATIAMVMLLFGYGYYRHQERELLASIEQDLLTLTEVKVRQLTHWWSERLGDARLMQGSGREEAVSALVSRRHAPSSEEGLLLEWLRGYQSYGQYDRADLLDDHGVLLLSSSPGGPAPAREVVAAVARALAAEGPTLVDFYRDEGDGRVRLTLLVPLTGGQRSDARGVVVALRIDPDAYLYPVVLAWSTPNGSGESLLVRKDGDHVTVLSRLRGDDATPLLGRIALSSRGNMAVEAALGRTGVLTAVDSRGVPVMGFIAPVPGSAWVLLSRIERQEVTGRLWGQALEVAGFEALILLSSGAVVGLVWARQRTRHFKKSAEMAQAINTRDERLRQVLKAGGLGFWDTNLLNGEVFVSPEFTAMMGYGIAGLWDPSHAGLDNVHVEDRETIRTCAREFLAGERPTYRVEFRLRTKSGDWKWVLSQARVSERSADGRPARLSGVDMDVTSIKHAEERSRRFAQLYAAGSYANAAVLRSTTAEQLFPAVCQAIVTHGGMALAWVGLIDTGSGLVNPVACAGGGAEEFGRVSISIDPTDPQASASAATCIRESRPVWVDDFPRNPLAEAWRARAEPQGWTAMAVLPIRKGGRVAGILAICTRAVAVFDEDDRHLLTELAATIDFALDYLAAAAGRRDSLLEKEVLLKEVHHRVRNNLQVIASLMRLEAGRSADQKVASALGETQSRIYSMALLHETLYRSGILAQVDLAVYLTQVARQVFQSSGPKAGVTLDVSLEPAMADMDIAMPCGLVVTELISNALTHGFRNGRTGEMRLSLERLPSPDRALRLTVADTGAGLPADFDARRSAGLGLQLVASLAHQLQGALEIGPGPGGVFSLSFVPSGTAPGVPSRKVSEPSTPAA